MTLFNPTRAFFVLILILISSLTVARASDSFGPQPMAVTNLQLDRYLGRWFEIGTIRQSFQKNCECTTAAYRLSGPEADFVRVLNTCYNTQKREWTDASGRGYFDKTQPNMGKLRVGFFLPQIPFLRGDYWIIALDKEYQWAMISNEEGSTLWILSRTPTLDETLIRTLLGQAKAVGISTENYRPTRQNEALCESRPTSAAQN